MSHQVSSFKTSKKNVQFSWICLVWLYHRVHHHFMKTHHFLENMFGTYFCKHPRVANLYEYILGYSPLESGIREDYNFLPSQIPVFWGFQSNFFGLTSSSPPPKVGICFAPTGPLPCRFQRVPARCPRGVYVSFAPNNRVWRGLESSW